MLSAYTATPHAGADLVIPVSLTMYSVIASTNVVFAFAKRSQLHLSTGSEDFNPAGKFSNSLLNQHIVIISHSPITITIGIPFSSEHENPEDSGLHQQLHSFNGLVQRDQIDQVD